MTSKRILIVEDERITAEDLRDTLESMGYEVIKCCSRGDDALEVIKSQKPDLVILDIQLQGDMDGIGVGEHIKINYSIPFIYLTAFADDPTLDRLKLTEPYGYIQKPFDNNEIYGVIETALYKYEMTQKLVEQKAWLNTTLNSIGDAVIATDIDGKITFMNPVAVQATGWQENEAIGQNLQDIFNIINEQSRSTERNPVDKVLESGKTVGLANHTLLIRKDKIEIPIDDSAAPIKDSNNQTIGVVLIFRDISDRKKIQKELEQKNFELSQKNAELLVAHKELAKSEALLQSIFRAAPTGIGMVKNRVFTWTNKMIHDISGFSAEELEGQSSRMLYPSQEEFEYVGKEKYEQISAKGTGTVVTKWKRKDGKVIDVLLSSTPLNPKDNSEGVTFTALDLGQFDQYIQKATENE